MIQSPLKDITSSGKTIWFCLLALTLLLLVLLNLIGAPLINPTAPYGIISYELAGSVQKSQAILNSWETNAQLHAALSLGVDYLFMVLYALTISLACLWAARVILRKGWPFARLGAWLAYGVCLAAVLDAVENIALVQQLFGKVVPPWPEIARWCALIKFGLIFIGLVFAFLGVIAYLFKQPNRSE